MDEKIQVDLMNTTETLLDEIADRNFSKKDVAKTYRLAIESSDKTDWERVNNAIIVRWGLSGLEKIKELAWSGKCFE